MGLPLRKECKKYNYSDYLSWDDDERWEIIDGIAYMMAAPLWQHQSVLGNVYNKIYNFLKDKECRVFLAPFDVRLPDGDKADEEIETVVQPDITIICDKLKLKGTGYFGVPKFIAEVLSPNTAAYDKKIKLKKYEEAGVKEYWIIDPLNKMVDVFILNEHMEYNKSKIYSDEDTVNLITFPEIEIDLKDVFNY